MGRRTNGPGQIPTRSELYRPSPYPMYGHGRSMQPHSPSHPHPLLPHPRRRRLLKALHFTLTTTTCKASSLSSPTPTYEALSPHQKNQISLFVDALLQWNQRMNLTAVTAESEVMTRHVEDSLAMLAPLQQSYLARCGGSASCDALNLVDVGSGAGLPGLILAIARPYWKFTLLESMQKRCLFLDHVAG
uniref:Ribosomal RNA small subunit methyltransferase G n=1 Tax=Ananas comosus var. bracteatus TaxID=296719 RepID=A0A6V7P7I6_ANACO|nr:unnamed protein product [Ananas comosus var. bracteatus]